MTRRAFRALKLAQTPTPLHSFRSNPVENARWLAIKRDDLTGGPLTGNKVRKLEFLLAHALESGATAIITCGGIQSNHARATAIAATQLGLKVHLILRGEEPAAVVGNLALARWVGAQVHWVTPEEYRERDGIFASLETALRKAGERPYSIPEGGSNALGMEGYRKAYGELLDQLQSSTQHADYVYTAVGSGGTFAGLYAGWMEGGRKGPEPIGIPVCDDAAYFRPRIQEMLADFHTAPGIPSPNSTDFTLLDGFVGKGYAISQPHEIDTIARLARLEGILLDPVYTVKAFLGMCAHLSHPAQKGASGVFIHTGGVFGLMADTLPPDA